MAELALYWLLILAAGAALVELVDLDWFVAERVAASLVAGTVGATMVSYLLALWWGAGTAAALVGPAVLLVVAGAIGRETWLGRARGGAGWLRPAVARQWRRRGARFGTGLALLLGIGTFALFSRALVQSGQTIYAGFPTVWADWGVHAAYAESFRLGANLPARDSLESATAMRYPFMVDFQPALLQSLGQNLVGSLDVPSWLVSWGAMILIWHLGWRVTRRLSAATVALLLVLFGGGLGFVGAYGDGCQQLANTTGMDASACTSLSTATPGAVAQFVFHLPTELTHLPRSYDGQSQTHPPLPDLEWYEPLLVFWLPQRDFDFGMALAAGLAILLWEAYRGRRRGPALAAGLVGAALPWFNPFGYLAAGLIGLWWLGRGGRWKELGYFLVPLAVFGLPRILFVIGGPHGQLDNPVGVNLFPQLDLGWLANASASCTSAQFHAGATCDAIYTAGASPLTMADYLLLQLARPALWGEMAGFWLSNTGIFLLVAAGVSLVAVLLPRLGQRRDQLELIRFAAPFWLLFLLANLVVTQPWNWDNTKMLQYWYLGAAIPVAWLLTATGRRLGWRILSGLLVGSLVVSGALSLDLAVVGQSNLDQAQPASTRLTWASPSEQLVARAVSTDTPSSAIFLTEGEPYDPVTALAGRTVALAYDGWLWSYGQPLRARYDALAAIYAGCAGGARNCGVGTLLRRYRISYVEFEPADYNGYKINEAWYREQHLPVVVDSGGYLILRVTSLWSRTG